jgi:hypothetical protein
MSIATSGPVALSGFFTTQIYLQGKTLSEIEVLVGYDRGRLRQGAWFATAIRLPGVDDFELAGYSMVAAHRIKEQYGDLNNPNGKLEEDAYKRKKLNAMLGWSGFGSQRLIKIIPMTGHDPNMSDDYQYPPGSGIPQWRVKRERPILWRGICLVKDYPNGRFIPDEGFTPVKYK